MTELRTVEFADVDLDTLAGAAGRLVLFVPGAGTIGTAARRVNRLTKGAVARAVESEAFGKLSEGEALVLGWPAGLAAEAVEIVKLERRADTVSLRKAGAGIAKRAAGATLTVLAEGQKAPEEIALGLVLRSWAFTKRKETPSDTPGKAVFMVKDVSAAQAAWVDAGALAAGVCFTRDLVSEPANVLTTTEFAAQLEALRDLGVEVEVLDEPEMEKLRMRALLGVGQGSESPSKVVTMRWKGGEGAPLALIGKGVVFDTGGISLKPGAGMEDMTMDMGGAGVVAGVMKALALRKAKANVTGMVGLVENMPDGRAQRPGDIVASMKGDTIEVINTDAEGRLVLADVLWHAQQAEKPAAMVDLATLTGACIIALGHENAAVFANDDGFAGDFLKAAETEGEGAWRMPLGKAYDDLIKSMKADIKNTGGRPAGSITAAAFLQKFVAEDMPWIHLDIAGVAQTPGETALAPKGATGWGVLALDRLVRMKFEG